MACQSMGHPFTIWRGVPLLAFFRFHAIMMVELVAVSYFSFMEMYGVSACNVPLPSGGGAFSFLWQPFQNLAKHLRIASGAEFPTPHTDLPWRPTASASKRL